MKEFHGLDLNTKEKEICRKNPIAAVQQYRKRTKLGIRDAKAALEHELGMPYNIYNKIKEKIAFSLFYRDKRNKFHEREHNVSEELRSWRNIKGDDHIWAINVKEFFYSLADKILTINDSYFDETDPRNV